MIKRLEKKIRQRRIAMKEGDFSKAEAIKKELLRFGVNLTDSNEGTFWNFNQVSIPKKPPSSNLALKFSLSQEVIFPQ